VYIGERIKIKEVVPLEDKKIVMLYWDRDEQAIPATAEKYGSYCTAIARNILVSREDAEECVNDTYMSAWNSMPPNRPDLLSAFLGKITRNLSFNRYKHNTADKRGGGELPVVLDELSDCVSGSSDVDRELDLRELSKAIDDFLNTLPRDKRCIFVSRYWYTDSISDIAKQSGMKVGTVTMTLSRLRGKLHDYLLEREFEP
jgi:RNA polymerase sigma-70 factor (ECF subfamily)